MNELYMGCKKLDCGDETLGVKPGMLQEWARPTPDCGGKVHCHEAHEHLLALFSSLLLHLKYLLFKLQIIFHTLP